MSVVVGTGEYRYEVVQGWAKLPEGWSFFEVAAVGVDRHDNVYAFNRGEHPVMVFDHNGKFLRSWGEGIFGHAHGLHVAPDDTLFLTDDLDHTVRKCTTQGKVLLTIGTPGKPAPFMSGLPFHRCTHTALSPKGDIYVADGYGNARIHKYSPDGRLIKSWGESGTLPGQFNIAHNITCDPDGWVYVADRENHRIQVFDGEGRFEAQWNDLHRPCAMHMDYCSCPICHLVEMGAPMTINRDFKNIGPRLSVLDNKGKVLARIGTQIGLTADSFVAPHGVAVDSTGSVYVAEVPISTWPALYPDKPIPKDICTLRKLVKVTSDHRPL